MCTMSEPRFEPASNIDLDRDSAPGKRNRKRTLVIALLAVLVVSLAGLGLYLTQGSPESEQPKDKPVLAQDPPPTGKYAIRAAHSKLCLGVGPEIKDGEVNKHKEVFVQQKCEDRFPPTGLRAQGNGLYRIGVDHPDQGPGCGKVDGVTAGNLVQPTKCAKVDEQFFLFERTGDTYVIRLSADPEVCLGIIDGSRKPGAQVLTEACGSPGQKWYVEKP